MTQYSRVGIVTGANKGIGYAIVRQLALQYPQSASNSGRLLIYLAARDKNRGEEAANKIRSDAALRRAKALSSAGGLVDVKFHQLDIADDESTTSFHDFVKARHPEGIDFLINNAGIAMDGFNMHVVESTLRCNYYGTLAMTTAFLPLMKPSGGRIVNVASTAGRLSQFGSAVASPLLAAARSASPAAATQLMADFADAVRRGRERAEGWPSAAYATSKAGEIAATMAVARQARREGREAVLINACCPGWVVTDMTKGRGAKTPDEGAQTPVMLTIGDIGGRTGGFWRDEQELDWAHADW